MSKLRAPLRLTLEDLPSEEEIQRIWKKVQKRRARRQVRRELRPAVWVGAAFAAACAALLLLSWVRPVLTAGPLTVAGNAPGRTLGQVIGDVTDAGVVELSDGSRIVLDPGARLEVLENSSRAFGMALRSGRAAFEVRPGGPRRWTVEAGLATVEVVGTRFTVARSEQAVDVAVERGVVVVRGDRVPDRVRKLVAGERLVVSEPRAGLGAAPTAVVSASPEAPSAPLEDSLPAPSAPPVAAAPSGAAASAAGFDELIAQADAARRRGDLRGAESALERALSSAPDRKRAALAAFTLGKLELDSLGNPNRAAAAFARAVSLGPPAAIAEDALARLVEAEGAAGQLDKARADALEYRKRYPNGRRSYAVGKWLREP